MDCADVDGIKSSNIRFPSDSDLIDCFWFASDVDVSQFVDEFVLQMTNNNPGATVTDVDCARGWFFGDTDSADVDGDDNWWLDIDFTEDDDVKISIFDTQNGKFAFSFTLDCVGFSVSGVAEVANDVDCIDIWDEPDDYWERWYCKS